MLLQFPRKRRHGRTSAESDRAALASRSASNSKVIALEPRSLAMATISRHQWEGMPRGRQELTVDALRPSAVATSPVPPKASIISPVVANMATVIVRKSRTGQEFANNETADLGKCVAIRVMLDPPKITGPRLHRLRIALGYPEQKPFAKALGLGKSTYSEIENGVKRISIKTADKLWTKFRIPLPYTFYGDESQLSPDLRQKIDHVA